MGAPKFTPGPWFVSGVRATIDGQRWLRVLRETTEQELAFIPYGDRTQEEHVQTTADANLAASAPDLFEALKDYRQRFYSAVIATGSADAEIATLACAKADAALAKALGGK